MHREIFADTKLQKMNRTLILAMIQFALVTSTGEASDFQLVKRTVARDSNGNLAHELSKPIAWKPETTAVILCDVWDYHHSINAVRRLEEMLPRMNELLKEARRRGATIIHAPSDCMPTYEKHAARLRAVNTPKTELPKDIASWCSRIPSEEAKQSMYYPIDQSDGGEDDDPEEHRQWAAKLMSLGRNPAMPWKAQSPGIEIDAEKDYISDRGDEVWSILKDRHIEHVILLGVHTNMCVLGRPFGLRQMAAQKMDVVLVRDLTDCMYNPKRWPYVDHFTGNDLVVAYVERYVCPTITSDQILSGQALRFANDKRPVRDVISIPDNKPNAWQLARLEGGNLAQLQAKDGAVMVRCAVRFPLGSLEQPGALEVPLQVTGAWLNGKPLEMRVTDTKTKEYQIPKDLTYGNDDANLLVLQIGVAGIGNDSVMTPRVKTNRGNTMLNGNWEMKAGFAEADRSIPLPAKFGMSPEVFYSAM